MKPLVAVSIVAGLLWTASCSKPPAAAQSTQTPASGARAARSNEAADGAAPGERRAVSPEQRAPAAASRDFCALLTSAEVADVTGLAVERAEKKPNGCEWYANAAARQRKGAQSVADTFAALTKEEPKTQGDAAASMETMLRGLTSAAGQQKPLFAVSVESEHADQAEAAIKTSVAVAGGGLPGGGLEPIEGLGDRAYAGPAGAFYCVRKGSMFITFGLSTGTREQAIALAQKIISRIE